MNISGSKLSDVSTDTLKSVLRKMKLLRVENCRFSETQVNTIFEQISEGESELESLYIGNNRLTGARPELLRGAVPRLRSLHCDNTNLCPGQITEMLLGIKEAEDLRLEEINLMMNNMTPVNHLLLCQSLNRLKSVNIWGCEGILWTLLDRIHDGESNIQTLDIGLHDLCHYPEAIIAGAITNCVSVRLDRCPLTLEQVSAITEKITTKENLKLKHLQMSGDFTKRQIELIQVTKNYLESVEFDSVFLM